MKPISAKFRLHCFGGFCAEQRCMCKCNNEQNLFYTSAGDRKRFSVLTGYI